MRERSHKKGETYQQDVKHWLSRTSFLTFDAELFGDTYDVTKKACANDLDPQSRSPRRSGPVPAAGRCGRPVAGPPRPSGVRPAVDRAGTGGGRRIGQPVRSSHPVTAEGRAHDRMSVIRREGVRSLLDQRRAEKGPDTFLAPGPTDAKPLSRDGPVSRSP